MDAFVVVVVVSSGWLRIIWIMDGPCSPSKTVQQDAPFDRNEVLTATTPMLVSVDTTYGADPTVGSVRCMYRSTTAPSNAHTTMDERTLPARHC